MSWRTVLLVFRKELLDFARDRRAVLLMLVLPVILYPLLIVGFHYALLIQLQVLEAKTAKVWVKDKAALPPALAKKLEDPARHLTLEQEPEVTEDQESDALAKGKVRAIVHLPPGLESEIAAIETTVPIEVVYMGGLDPSLEARHKISEAVRDWRQEIVRDRMKERGLNPSFVEPVMSTFRDVAPKGALIGRVLAVFLVLSSLMGAFYPAIDLGAGEKERGTLETLLLAPAHRVEIALGKYLAVATVALASALINLISLAVTFSHFMSLASTGDMQEKFGSVTVTLGVVGPMLLALFPLVALFSGLALAIATHATSYKEATTYLQPLAIVASLLSVVGALPGVELTFGVCLVPVAGVSLLFKELLGGTAKPEYVVLVSASSLAYAALALRWVAHLYTQEDVLARPAAAVGLDLLRRRKPGERGVPNAAQGFAAAILALLLFWFAGEKLQGQPGHIVSGLAVSLILLIFLPPLVVMKLLRLDAKETLSLRPPPRRALLAALLFAIAGPVILPDLARLQSTLTGDPLPQFQEAFVELTKELMEPGPIIALGVLGLLPAICEEALFRGFVLAGLRTAMPGWRAALIAGLLFGLNHLDPAGLGARTALGFAIGMLVVRSESLAPAVLCHFVHNGLTLVFQVQKDFLVAHGLVVDGGPSWLLRGAAIALAVAGILVLRGVKPAAVDSKAVAAI